MNAQRSGVWIAMAAILVQAPRLVLAVLAADHQSIGAAWERGLLVVAGIGTATVLTGGNLYLAHAIGSARRRRRWLVGVWLLVLASTGGLVVPLIAAGLGGRTLPLLLGGAALTWTWSGLAALAHEVTAAGCVLAAAALGGDAAAAERQELLDLPRFSGQFDVAWAVSSFFLRPGVCTSSPGLWKVWKAARVGGGGRVCGGPGAGFQGAAETADRGPRWAGAVERSDTGGPCWVRGFRRPGTFHSPCLRWVGEGLVRQLT